MRRKLATGAGTAGMRAAISSSLIGPNPLGMADTKPTASAPYRDGQRDLLRRLHATDLDAHAVGPSDSLELATLRATPLWLFLCYGNACPNITKRPTIWLEHWQDEADAAFLYRLLAEAEPAPERQDVYRRLAAVEDRHAALWRKLLADAGVECGTAQPSRRARFLAWTAHRFGPGVLTTLLLREEGREVKGYMDLYRATAPGAAKDISLTLAKESAEHAETLGGLAGKSGEPWHQMESGGFLRNVVYGFNDGLTANFGLVAGVIGASVAPHVVLLSGVAGHGGRRALDGLVRLPGGEERAGGVRARDRDGGGGDPPDAGGRDRGAGARLRGEGDRARRKRSGWPPR